MIRDDFAQKQGLLLRGLLALVNDVGGNVDGRVRIQKSAYLLKALGVPDFQSAKFRYHYYGPYSRELSNELHNAVLDGLLEETALPSRDDPKSYAYRLTDVGQEWLSGISKTETNFFLGIKKSKLDILKKQDARKLELAATIVYLKKHEQKTNDTQNALEQALVLKPHCIPFKDGVLQTLHKLGIPNF